MTLTHFRKIFTYTNLPTHHRYTFISYFETEITFENLLCSSLDCKTFPMHPRKTTEHSRDNFLLRVQLLRTQRIAMIYHYGTAGTKKERDDGNETHVRNALVVRSS